MSNRTLFAFAVVSALYAVTVLAAEPTDDDRSAAQEAFGRGMSERARGDRVASLASFKGAHARLPSPITGLELGRAYMLLGRFVEARREFDAVVRSPAKPVESSIAKAARTEAAALSTEVGARIAKVSIVVTGAHDDLVLTIDGVVVVHDARDSSHDVDPGRHHVVAEHGGLKSDRAIDVAEGSRATVTFVFGAQDVSSYDRVVVDSERHAPTWVYGALVVGGVGIGVGSIAGLFALSDRSTLGCTSGRCTGTQTGVDGLNRNAEISTISFAIGVAGVGLGVYGLLTGSSRTEPSKSASVEPWIGFGSIGLTGSF
ncbi:MAG: tetratricopeptide repeat protein [Polyangiales bacterium]